MSDSMIENDGARGLVLRLLGSVTSLLWGSAKLAIGFGGVVAAILYFKQNSLLYFPQVGEIPLRPEDNPYRYRSPEEHSIPFQDCYITCQDGVKIHAWLLTKQQSQTVPTIIFFHGNAGNIGLRLPNALHMYQHLNANVLLVEYRGYGNSDQVTPDEAGLKLDAQAALHYLIEKQSNLIDIRQIFIFGRSLGGAVAFDLAAYAQTQNIPVAGVIVENTFLSISHMVDHLMPYLAPFKALVLRIGWRSYNIVPSLQAPILYLAGAKDQLVPHTHMLELYRMSVSSKLLKLYVVKSGTHNETWVQGGMEYWNQFKAFMNGALSTSASSTRTTPKTTLQGTAQMPNDDPLPPSATAGSSAIPIMPTGIMGMARETLRSDSSGVGSKKEL